MTRHRVIDADGHSVERDQELAAYARYRGVDLAGHHGIGTMPLFPSLDGWFRIASDKLSSGDAESWQAFLDATGIERTVLHPTAGLAFGLIQDPDWSESVAEAYNRWLYERYLKVDARFQGVALLPLHRPDRGARELRRAREEFGMVGGILPAATGLATAYGDRRFDPIYEEAVRLDCPLTVHGAPSKGLGFDFFDTFIKTHTLEHPFAIMIQFTSMMFDGVFERFPDLRLAFFEAGIGWVPYLLDRMEEEFERRGKRWCPFLSRTPREYVATGNIYFSAEIEETTLRLAVDCVGPGRILYASDFPHERDPPEFLGDVAKLVARADLSDTEKRMILFENANRFYRLGVD